MNHLKKAAKFFFYLCRDDDFQSFASVSFKGKKRKKVEEGEEKKNNPKTAA